MIQYNQKESRVVNFNNKKVSCFYSSSAKIDKKTVQSFGEEWQKFSSFSEAEIKNIGDEYFDIVDESILNSNSTVLDMGCGSGRWSKYLAPNVKFIEAIDPSDAIFSATKLLSNVNNIRTTQASSDNIPFNDETFDFVFSLGVLHHIPETQTALIDTVKKVKKGGYLLIYLYYNLDNRGVLYKALFKLSSVIRFIVAALPKWAKQIVCDFIAITVYMPLILVSRSVQKMIPNKSTYQKLPLAYYVGKSFNIIRNDALDRFGTPLEQRFSKKKIKEMMEKAGLRDINFSNNSPYWHAIGKRTDLVK